MGSDAESKPVRCGCESKVEVKQRTYPVGRQHYTTDYQVVCGYCGAAGSIEMSPISAVDRWNEIWSPRFGSASPTTRLVAQILMRSPWRRVGWRSRIKVCAYCPAWRVRGYEPEPHRPGCAWAEAKRALGSGVSDVE